MTLKITYINRLRTHDDSTIDGKLFCAFIALIVASEIDVKLTKLMNKKSWSKDHVIKEMEKIVVCMPGKGQTIIKPATKTQQIIMRNIGLSEEDLKRYITKYWP